MEFGDILKKQIEHNSGCGCACHDAGRPCAGCVGKIPGGRYLRGDEVARIFAVHPRTVRNLTEAGKIPALRISNRWRYDLDQVREWARNQSKLSTVE